MTLRRPLPFLAGLAAALSLGACAAGMSSLDRLYAMPTQEYRGHYTIDADGSWFRRCGAAASDDAWWVTVTGGAVAQMDSARSAGQVSRRGPTFVQWRGVVTRGGEVGPAGSTALIVREVVAVRPGAAGDCP